MASACPCPYRQKHRFENIGQHHEPIDPLISTSFDLAIKKEHLFADNDQALLHIHQPLRIEKGAMTLNYATWRSSDRIIYGQQTIPLVPSGRSIELAVGYQIPVPIPITFRSAYIHNHEHTKGKKAWQLLLDTHLIF